MIQTKRTTTAGFALLMTLMVVSVIISVTAAIIELSLKQLELAVTARDSEIAFQAANAGMECVRYGRRVAASVIEDHESDHNAPPFNCFGASQSFNLGALTPSPLTSGNLSYDANADDILYYTSDLSWSTGDRCSEVKMLIMNVSADSLNPVSVDRLEKVFLSYPANTTKSCDPGGFCTIAQVTGYNKSCADKKDIDTVRREILLEF